MKKSKKSMWDTLRHEKIIRDNDEEGKPINNDLKKVHDAIN